MDLTFDLKCPNCGHSIRNLNARHLGRGAHKSCPYCGLTLVCNDDGFRDAQRAIDQFKSNLSRMFR